MEQETIKVCVTGAAGRVGRAIIAGINDAPGTELVGAVDLCETGRDAGVVAGIGDIGIAISGSLDEALAEGRPDVVVDFTLAGVVPGYIRAALSAGCHVVVGTTGLTAEDLDNIERETRSSGRNVIIAPNFSLGALLMIELSRLAARHFSTVEIIERHHDGKQDSPSGTALRTAAMLAETMTMKSGRERLDGDGRGHDVAGVKVHAVRLPGLCAHQEVVFGGAGETLTIRHDTIGRECYVSGVLLAVKKVASLPGLTVGMEKILFPE
ncbi:MAG: 4-hydroxy-tetrahydrodipicolinate reductase [Gemmatimonadota bacterium]|nr:4-hydroxy-tetrahydrodipicolinate reductase [Gemmatimonadota bacterium]